MPIVEKELPRRRRRIIPIRLLNQQYISKRTGIPQERQLVFIPPRAFYFGGIRKPETGLPQQIKRDIRQRNIFFEYRTVATPLRQSLAQNQTVIAEAQQVVEMSVRDFLPPPAAHKTSDAGTPCYSPARITAPFHRDCWL